MTAPDAITLERIHADPPIAGRLPRSAKMSPGGRYASWLQPSAADSEVLELWARPLPAGSPRRLASVADLIGNREARLTEAEKMALERRRVNVGGITDYGWCGEQDTRLIVPLAGDLYLIDLDAATVQVKRLTTDEKEPERNPSCDPQARQVAYVKQGDLWVQPLDGRPARRLTKRSADGVSVGLPEFIAAEEFDRFDGYWWSRDGRRLLAMEVDERAVPIQTRMQIRASGSDLTRQHYPAAGQRNATVVPWLIDVADARAQRLALPESTEYIVRAGWFDDGTPWLQAMTRDQTSLRLVDYPDRGSKPRTIIDEIDPAWVDVNDDLHELKDVPNTLLWSSERSGRRQLWRIDRTSGAVTPLTASAEPVSHVVCVGSGRIVFAAEQSRNRAQVLFERDAEGLVKPVDSGPAQRWSDASGDRACQRLLITESSWGRPPHMKALALDAPAGTAAVDLAGDPADPLLERIVPVVQSLDLMAADGSTPLNAFYLPPLKASADPAGHAVIVAEYGGPGVHTVAWQWTRSLPLYAHWQRLGFGVLMVDTRGMKGRGRDFSRAHYRAIGQVEVDDLFAAVRQLPTKVAGIDTARIGVIGWSYGGFLAARSVLDAATPFAAAVAGAPVVDWTLYDTAYTERYLGNPAIDGTAGYAAAGLVGRASLLEKPLLILHGTADDNVLFENSLRLIQALQNEGKLFETVIYPGQTHSISSRKLQLHVDRAATEFFVRRLKP